MEEQRQPFRFRLPWLAPQQPAAQPQRPRSQSTTSIPIRRFSQQNQSPPPKPDPPKTSLSATTTTISTKSTSQTPSIDNESLKADSQFVHSSSGATAEPQSSSLAVVESPKSTLQSTSSPSSTTSKPTLPSSQSSSSKSTAIAKPSSPSRSANDSPTAKPDSPSRATPESRVGSQVGSQSPSLGRPRSKVASTTSSPSKVDSKSKTISSPSTPSRSASQAQREPGKSSLPMSPSRLTPQKSTVVGVATPRKAAQKEPETTINIVSQSSSSSVKPYDQGSSEFPQTSSHSPIPSQESKPKVEIQSESTKKSALQDYVILGDETEGTKLAKHALTSEEVKAESTPPKNLNSSAISKGIVQELLKEEKSKADYKEETRQKTIAETPGSGSNSNIELQAEKGEHKRDNFSERKEGSSTTTYIGNVESQAAKGQHKRENFSERKEGSSTAIYIGKHIKTASPSQPVEENATRMSFQNSVKEEAPRQREIKEDISKLVSKLTTEQFGEKQVVVITLTGENSGASMLLSTEQAKKEASIHIHRGYKTNPEENQESTTDEETHTDRKRLDDNLTPAAKAYVNSNVQSINNSIVVEASVPGMNPGVHLVFSQHNSEAVKAIEKSKFIETRKAEFTSARAERLIHEPTVRRRCLRGLLLESSDSETDNPNKPRRHGCRYSCGEIGKEKEIM